MIRLDVGAGDRPKPGYIPVDPYVDFPDGIKAPMWELPFEDDSVHAIYCSHALEHVTYKESMAALREWYRVLKPTYCVEILVPDMDWIARNWLNQREANSEAASMGWHEDVIFGRRTHPGEAHVQAFWKQKLIHMVQEAGFKPWKFSEQTETHSQNTLCLIAIKEYR